MEGITQYCIRIYHYEKYHHLRNYKGKKGNLIKQWEYKMLIESNLT